MTGWPWSAWRLVRRAAARTAVLAVPAAGTGLGGLVLSGRGAVRRGPARGSLAGLGLVAFEPASCGFDAGDSGWQAFLAGAEVAQQVGGGLGGHAEAGAERVAGDGLPVLVLVLGG
ncbi:MAG TPA: hypothetical protein VHN16_10475, partial [Streptosporangiaceae bacterium]|nr:hypothetical protein [Streptosporangiaceae bacterium]